jgi:hypothetical protein
MTYMRLKKHEGIRLFKDMLFSKITLDFLHNSHVEAFEMAYRWISTCKCTGNNSLMDLFLL